MIKLNTLEQPAEVKTAVLKVLKSGRYVKGPLAGELEEKWAERCEMPFAIAVSSGAMALEVLIQAIDSHYGVANQVTYSIDTFKAVPNAITRMGKLAIGVEENPMVFAHHLHNQTLESPAIFEDCSHVHGYKPKSHAAIFSFFPTKILGACGDAGIIVTDKKDIYDECMRIRSHGEPDGTNARMDEIQAAVLLAKLPYLDSYIERRQEIVNMYDKGLDRKTEGDFHYAYCIPGSEAKKNKLIEMGVESAFYYTPEFMALPLYPELTNEQVQEVISAVQRL